MRVSRVQLVSVRDVWRRYPGVDHSWPAWTFLVRDTVLAIGDLANHRCLLVMAVQGDPEFRHLFAHPGRMAQDFESLRVNVKAAGSFRITREGVLAIQRWGSAEINITTPPEAYLALEGLLQSAITEKCLPWTPHSPRWEAY